MLEMKSMKRILQWLWIWDRHPDQIPDSEMLTVSGFFRFFAWPCWICCVIIAVMIYAANR